MTSIIKVDTIQTSAGGTPTASSLGIGGVGKIGQVLQGRNSTTIATSLSLVDFDAATVTITPSATSSKILILCNLMGIEKGTGSANTRIDIRIYRDSTQLTKSNANRWTYNTNIERDGGFAINWLDTPSSISAINYRLNFQWLDTVGSTCYVNKDGNSGSSSITVMEVLA